MILNEKLFKVYENVDILRLPSMGSNAEAAANKAGINIHYVHPLSSADVPYTTTRVPADMAYYTSTLPHQRPHHPMLIAQNGGQGNGPMVPDAPTRQRHSSRPDPRATSEPRKKSGGNQQPNVVTSTLDRYVGINLKSG